MSKLLHDFIFRVNQVFRVLKEYRFKRNLINEIKCFATVAAICFSVITSALFCCPFRYLL